MTDTRPTCRHCGDPRRPVSRPRGLCWGCYYAPGVKELYHSTHPMAPRAARGFAATDPADDRTACVLELWAGLLRYPTTLYPDEWVRALARLPARYARAVVLRVLHGMEWWVIGERLGYPATRSGREYPRQMFTKALRRLARDPLALSILGGITPATTEGR